MYACIHSFNRQFFMEGTMLRAVEQQDLHFIIWGSWWYENVVGKISYVGKSGCKKHWKVGKYTGEVTDRAWDMT